MKGLKAGSSSAGGGISPSKKYIFKDGELFVGMNAYAYKPSSISGSTMNGTISITNNLLQLSQNSGNYGTSSYITTAIDVTNVNSIKFTVDSDNSYVNYFYSCITDSIKADYTSIGRITVTTPRTGTTWAVDTSSLTGNKYFVFIIQSANSYQNIVNIREIELL